MKRIFYLFIVLTLFSCESPITEKIKRTYPNKQPEQINYFQVQNGKEVKIKEK